MRRRIVGMAADSVALPIPYAPHAASSISYSGAPASTYTAYHTMATVSPSAPADYTRPPWLVHFLMQICSAARSLNVFVRLLLADWELRLFVASECALIPPATF